MEKTCSSNPSELLLYPAKEQSTILSTLPSASPKSPKPSLPSPNVPSDKPSPPPSQQRTPSAHLTRSGSHSPQSPVSSSSSPSPPSSPAALSPDLRLKLEELLEKYSNGLWAHALPKLFQDTYKVSILREPHKSNIPVYFSFCYFFIFFVLLQDETPWTCAGEPSPLQRLLQR